MRIDVLTDAQIDEATDQAICRLQRRSFPEAVPFRSGRYYVHRPRVDDRYVLAYKADQLIGQTVVYFAAGLAEGRRYRLACLGNVCSDPDHRGCGAADVCVRRAVELADEADVDWVVLFCVEHNVGFYKRFGFEKVGHDLHHTRTDGSTYPHGHDDVCMVRPVSQTPWPRAAMTLDIENF